ncbi:FliI/YscN family ATPase [Candidatus Desantisbacteria bacterium]|nr:FliI/YscN family ATPase [Candidatus Desantisbacteria bacterium]
MKGHLIDLKQHFTKVTNSNLIKLNGRVTQITGLIIESYGPNAFIGELCHIVPKNTSQKILAEVVGFRNDKILLMPFGDIRGISPGSEVISIGMQFNIRVGEKLIGRVIDGLGIPIDDKGPINDNQKVSVYRQPGHPLSRKRISKPLSTGIKALDGLLSCGKGVVVVATSDQPPLVRIRAALVASTIAEYFRGMGKDVLLMMDSVTRFAMAQREVGLAVGEPPTSKGYPPSVFSVLPKLLERAGTHSEVGSITGLYTVLVEADDMNDPIADTVRSILDGHVVLSRNMASKNHYPAIDILRSVSRVMGDVTSFEHQGAAAKLKEVLSIYEESEDLINIGAYVPGSNSKIDYSLKYIDKIKNYLRQPISQGVNFNESVNMLIDLFRDEKIFVTSNVNRGFELSKTPRLSLS